MTPRLWAETALVVVAALFAWGYVHQRDERIRAEGRLELLTAAADSTAKAAEDAVQVSNDRAAAAEERASRAEAVGLEAQRRADAAGARVPGAVERVVAAAAPADSAAVRARVQELEAIHLERERALLDRIRADSVVIAELRAVDQTRVRAIASLESALAASQAKANAALESRPGWVERTLPKILIPVAFAVGVLVGR